MRSRLTWGIAGALASLIVSMVAFAGAPAAATQGEAVIAGQTNGATNDTLIQNTQIGVPCDTQHLISGITACGEAGLVAYGASGVVGYGAWGVTGVGTMDGDVGVLGQSLVSGTGVKGSGLNGVVGTSTSTGNGVEGRANNSAASGVYGQNDGFGFGVAGRANAGVGVLGDSVNGVGVRANSPGGTALLVDGKAQFSRSGTKAVAGTIAVPKSSAKISNVALTRSSFIIATAQKNIAGVWVVAAVPNISGNSITIYLNKAVTQSYPVGWMVIEHP